ncbi:MAG TPA: adenylosuccinate lyase [Planctomycetota bacterium]|nr:adenylosuccinate lyase [Planctomycetota bacterium]
MNGTDFESPLASRYAGSRMTALFTPLARAKAWRETWIALARAESELGAPVTGDQIAALERTKDRIDLDRVAAIEKETRHDVVAHIRAWGEVAPEAKPIIHLGATSMFVTDNADGVLFKSALGLLRDRLVNLARALAALAKREAATACLGYTHFQPAQPVTIGKRVSLWLQDVLWDLDEVESRASSMVCLGAKGATGTQASFLELFSGDARKVEALDRLVAEKLGFSATVALSGQTYPRKLDARLADSLAGIGASLGKMGVDLRLLAHTGELREAFLEGQVGSSAMPYKKNPMRAERLCALARLLPHLRSVLAETAAHQWLERSLDDSAARRVVLPEMFLAADGALRAAIDLVSGLETDKRAIESALGRELPFLASEAILALVVKSGGDRQAAHEGLRTHAMAARSSDSPDRAFHLALEKDPFFAQVSKELGTLLAPERLAGRAADQTRRFLAETVEPRLERLRSVPAFDDPLEV